MAPGDIQTSGKTRGASGYQIQLKLENVMSLKAQFSHLETRPVDLGARSTACGESEVG